jgi:hypothetical protein
MFLFRQNGTNYRLKKVKENKQPDDQSKQQSSGNYEKYNRGSYRGSFNTYQGHEVRGRSRYRGFGRAFKIIKSFIQKFECLKKFPHI